MSKVNISSELLCKYKEVILAVDIMFVNKVPYLVSISQHVKFIKKIISTYKNGGFKVMDVLADNKFEFIRGNLVYELI